MTFNIIHDSQKDLCFILLYYAVYMSNNNNYENYNDQEQYIYNNMIVVSTVSRLVLCFYSLDVFFYKQFLPTMM